MVTERAVKPTNHIHEHERYLRPAIYHLLPKGPQLHLLTLVHMKTFFIKSGKIYQLASFFIKMTPPKWIEVTSVIKLSFYYYN